MLFITEKGKENFRELRSDSLEWFILFMVYKCPGVYRDGKPFIQLGINQNNIWEKNKFTLEFCDAVVDSLVEEGYLVDR